MPRSLNVLVVDASHDAADSLADVLALSGHRATPAYTAADAARHLAGDPFDAMILDLATPGIDEPELRRALAGRDAGRRPHLIAVTCYPTEAVRRWCRQVGADVFLTKPAAPAVFLGLLDYIAETDAEV